MDHSRREQSQIGEATSIQRQALNRLLRHLVGKAGALGIDRNWRCRDGDGLGERSRSQTHLYHRNAAHEELHSAAGLGGHAGGRSADVVASGGQHAEDESALCVGDRTQAEAPARIGYDDDRGGDPSAAGVLDNALQ